MAWAKFVHGSGSSWYNLFQSFIWAAWDILGLLKMGMWSTSTLHFTRRLELNSAIPMFLEFFEWLQPYPPCCQDVLEPYARRQTLYKVVCSVWVFVSYLGWHTLFWWCTLCRVTYLMWWVCASGTKCLCRDRAATDNEAMSWVFERCHSFLS